MDIKFDFPNEISYRVQKKIRFNSGAKSLNTVDNFVIQTDKNLGVARDVLFAFSSSYSSENNEKPNAGFAKIREYKSPGSGFLFAEDKIAPGSVIVKRMMDFDKNGNEIRQSLGYFWVSEKRGKYGEPLVYALTGDEPGQMPLSHSIVLLNRDWDENGIRDANENLFKPEVSPEFNSEIEIWKQGKAVSEKSRGKSKKTAPRLDLLQPAPQPV